MKIKYFSLFRRDFGSAAFFRIIAATILVALPIVAGSAYAQDYNNLKPSVSSAVKFDLSPPLRTIKPNLKQSYEKGDDDRGEPGPTNNTLHDTDPVVQDRIGSGVFGGQEAIPPTGANFDGLFQSSGPTPPDTNGDIGPNHYVQSVNSRFQIFTRSGTSVFGPANINTLFSGFGGACQTENSGDPVVLYDQFADRWLISQFTANGPTYFNCVAVSTTSDPTGSYYRYAFTTGTNFPDYPKYGIWNNAYFISTREFANGSSYTAVGAYALNRDQILAGNPNPTVVSFVIPRGSAPYNVGDGLLPADLDGNTPPPANSPYYFVGSMDDGGPYGAPQDALTLWKFQLDWVTPANSSFSLANTLPIANFDTIFPCNGRNCIPQPGTSVGLDILSYRQRPLFRLAYRNLGTYESLVTTQSVEATTGIAGMRWWEIRSPNSAPVVFQEGTYAPGDGVHRWMGSVATDNKGNMAMGFSVSDGTSVFPGIRYTGRLATDPVGTLPQGEGTLIAGGGSQTSSGSRWGDYSSLNIDPTDDCAFWYTTEYYSATSSTGWRTRIGSFKFPNCTAATAQSATISGRVATASGFGIPGIRLTLTGGSLTTPRVAQSNSFGYYQFTDLPTGENYTITIGKSKYTFSPISQTVSLSGNFQSANFTTTQ